MSEMKAIGEAVQNLRKQYKSVIDMGDFLDRVGSLENYEAEIKARVEQAKKGEEKAVTALKQAQATAAEQESFNRHVLEAVDEEAKRIQAEARSKADKIVRVAEVTAQKVSEAAALVEAQTAQAKRDAAVEYERAQTAIIAKQKEYDTLAAEIDALKSKFK